MEEQKINVDALQLPELNLSPRHYHQYDSEDLDEYGEPYYDDDEDEDNSDLGHLVGYDDEEEIDEHRMRRYLANEGIEYMEADDDEVESRYAIYDSADSIDESLSNEDLSDENDAYKDLDDMELVRVQGRQRRTLIRVTRDGDGPDDEEILHEEEEEIDDDEAMEVDEEEIQLNNLNKETVTISRMPAGSGVVVKTTQADEGKSSTSLEQLKSARPPWKKLNEVSIERATEEDCPNKKFKSN